MRRLFIITGILMTVHMMMGQMIQTTISDGSMYSIHHTGGNILSPEHLFPEDGISVRMVLITIYVILGFVVFWKMTTREKIFSKCE